MPQSNLAAADRMLPLVRRIVINVRARHRLIAKRAAAAATASDPAAKRRDAAVAERLRADLAAYVAELKGLGVDVLDAASGLVGRKAEVGGRTVTVTWRPGQPSFSEWFAEGESVADRRPLQEEAAVFDV